MVASVFLVKGPEDEWLMSDLAGSLSELLLRRQKKTECEEGVNSPLFPAVSSLASLPTIDEEGDTKQGDPSQRSPGTCCLPAASDGKYLKKVLYLNWPSQRKERHEIQGQLSVRWVYTNTRGQRSAGQQWIVGVDNALVFCFRCCCK